jgi:BNR repeat-like domain
MMQTIRSVFLVAAMTVALSMYVSAQAPAGASNGISFIDLASDTQRQVIVDREKGQYLGHVSTLLHDDGKAITCVYPKGHGKGPIVMKRSLDGGLTWSNRIAVPENWSTSLETPTIHQVIDANKKRRLIIWSGLFPARLAVSEDDGTTWSPLAKVGEWGGIVVMGSVVATSRPGHYIALFHDDGRFLSANAKPTKPATMTLLQTESTDGGLTWSAPKSIFASDQIHLCEPGLVRSPDGKQFAVLLRENRRVKQSHLIISDDEGRTWSEPRELPWSLTGDRHTAVYGPDGRLFISFRDMASESETRGDWVAWVGTYDDVVSGKPGQYRVRLMDNKKGSDCAYPGVERLPDGTIVSTTYGHWSEGEEPYIVSVRLRLEELDSLAKQSTK